MIDIGSKVTKSLFDSRSEYLIIGLTGKTGSGCTTTRNLLCKSFPYFNSHAPALNGNDPNSDDDRDKRIVWRYCENHWLPFDWIGSKSIITSFIIESDATWQRFMGICGPQKEMELKDYFLGELEKELQILLSEYVNNADTCQLKNYLSTLSQVNISNEYDKYIDYVHTYVAKYISVDKRVEPKILAVFWASYFINMIRKLDSKDIVSEMIFATRCLFYKQSRKDAKLKLSKVIANDNFFCPFSYTYISLILPIFSGFIKKALDDSYIRQLQRFGNELRLFGTLNRQNWSGNFDSSNISSIAKRINQFIKIYRHPVIEDKDHSCTVLIVVDSIKNIYESMYLSARYSAYYLVSVTKNDPKRIEGLRHKFQLNDNEVDMIDYNERPSYARKEFEKFIDILGTLRKGNSSAFLLSDTSRQYLKLIADTDELMRSIRDNTIDQYDTSIIEIREKVKYEHMRKKVKGLQSGRFSHFMDILDDPIRVYSYRTKQHIFFSQDVEACIQGSDIFLTNNETNDGKTNLEASIMRYVSLIMHPGLVLPTPIERCMQIAYSAKVNSGCVSRQVGAVVTDRAYNILSLGWNDVPCGVVTCLRRNLIDVATFYDKSAYSDYEIDSRVNSEFREYVEQFDLFDPQMKKQILDGLPFVYCFKDVYTSISGDKNQVHSRALHAEERALALTAKNLTIGGVLFTTSSPCDMCSKRAKDAEISTVVYIEPYPGIAETNVTNTGSAINRAKHVLYQGAIGRAYNQMYAPVIPLKDELEYRGVSRFKTRK